ncbi:hypothetical protein, partial [Heyndrickxia sporothermodurans]
YDIIENGIPNILIYRGNCMKKFLLIVAVLIMVFVNTGLSKASNDSNTITQDQFLKYVKKSKMFKELKKDFLSKDIKKYYLLNPVINEDAEQTGWIVQYEALYNVEESKGKKNKGNENPKVEATLTSLVSFMYDFETKKLNTYVIDYNRLIDEKAIYLRYLDSGESEKIDVSDVDGVNEELEPFITTVEDEIANKEKDLEEASENIQSTSTAPVAITDIEPLAAGNICYQCSKLQKYQGDYSPECKKAVGTVCSVKITGPKLLKWAKTLICAGTKIIGCYIPAYYICVEGKWMTTCPAYD